MASGHVNRANRPNTWPLRPMLQVKILLANPEPKGSVAFGASVVGGRAEVAKIDRHRRLDPIQSLGIPQSAASIFATLTAICSNS